MMRFFNNIQLRYKLLVGAIFMVLLTGTLVGLSAYTNARNMAQDGYEDQISSMLYAQSVKLDTYFQSIKEDLIVWSENLVIQNALVDFNQAWESYPFNPMTELQSLYITDNPYPLGEKHKLDRADVAGSYHDVHARYHNTVRTFLEQRGYYDIFLINPEGDLIYSVFKENDYATNLLTGQWKDSDLGRVFKMALESEKGKISFTDFAPYGPSYDAPASFISKRVYSKQGNFVGVLVFQMPVDRITKIMSADSGFSEQGEFIWVGDDKYLRSQSRLTEEQTILTKQLDYQAIDRALSGETGFAAEDGLLIGYRPFQFQGQDYALLAVESEAYAYAPVRGLLFDILLFNVVITLICVIINYIMGGITVKPFIDLKKVLQRLGDGDYEVDVPHTNRGDEMGQIAEATETLREKAIKAEKEREENERAKAQAEKEKQAFVEKLANDFGKKVGALVQEATESVNELNVSAQQMSQSANNTQTASSSAFQASEIAATNVQSVSAAAEQLSASIREISQQVQQSSQVSNQSLEQARGAGKTVAQLDEGAQKIGDVINLINDIAEKVNLLALNATIEAARAGEAGKGFAVVANEVKNLATQTTQATEEIQQHINFIQSSTTETVNSVKTLEKSIEELDQIAGMIASAVEQQNSATSEIARNIQETIAANVKMQESMTSVQSDAEQTGAASSQVLSAAGILSEKISQKMAAAMRDFLKELRSQG